MWQQGRLRDVAARPGRLRDVAEGNGRLRSGPGRY